MHLIMNLGLKVIDRYLAFSVTCSYKRKKKNDKLFLKKNY